MAEIALALRLSELNYTMLDCGIWPTDHLKSLGAQVISRNMFLEILDQNTDISDVVKDWKNLFENWDLIEAAEKRFKTEHQDKEV